MGPNHPIHQLPKLVQEIEAELQFPPDRPEMREAPMAQPEIEIQVPQTYAEALRFMVNKPFIDGTRHKAQKWRAKRAGAHPDILLFEAAFTRHFAKLGVPMFAHCIWRTNEEQARLRLQGHTKAGPGESPHNWGRAVDLVHGTKAWELPRPCWDLVGHVGKEVAKRLGIAVDWGGDWKFYDPAHWELRNWGHLDNS